jgi:predicted AAA+ superfamily ATPase
VVLGARQVGKTYALEHFGRRSFSASHIINFEQNPLFGDVFQGSLEPSRILQELALVQGRPIDAAVDFLFFDEIQECPRALTSLKYFAEQMPALAICAAGSLLGVHLGDFSYPVGKVEELKMVPMTFDEFLLAGPDPALAAHFQSLSATNLPSEAVHGLLWREFTMYLAVGGMPEVVAAFQSLRSDLWSACEQVRKIQERLTTNHLADMAKHCGKQNAMHLERLWQNIPAQLSRDQTGSAPKFAFKEAIPGLRGYDRMAGVIDWLQAAGLILRHPIVNSGHLPFAAHSKENFFKLFVFDTGLLGALSRLPMTNILRQDYGSYKGYYAENFVAQEFHALGWQTACWREGQAEVEFLCEHEGRAIPAEVKSGQVTQSKSLASFQAKYQPPFSFLLSGKVPCGKAGGAKRHLPLYMASKLWSQTL